MRSPKSRLLNSFLLVCLALLPGWVQATEADQVYDLAGGYYKKERWPQAVAEYRKFLTNWPEDSRVNTARLYLGFSELNAQDYKSARRNLRLFADANPESKNIAQVRYRIAECSYLLDEMTTARQELLVYLEKYPNDVYVDRALPYLADSELRLGRFSQAEVHFREAITKFPQGDLLEDSKFGLARALEGMQHHKDATQVYLELIQNPNGSRTAEALLNLGARQFEDKDFAGSVKTYEQLETRFPRSDLLPLARLNHGFALYRLARFDDAMKQFEGAANVPAQAMAAELWRGLCYKARGDYARAIEIFAKAREAQPQDPLCEDLLYQQADCEQRRGQPAVAQKLFLNVTTDWPKGNLADDALYFAAVNALEQGQIPETEKLLKDFETRFPESGLRWHYELLRGRLKLQSNDLAAARTQFEKVLQGSESETTKAWGQYYLAYADYQSKNYAEAAKKCDQLVAQLNKMPPERADSFSGFWILQAAVQLELGKAASSKDVRQTHLANVEKSVSHYLIQQPQGGQVTRAWALRALAAAHSGNKELTSQALMELKARGGANPGTDLQQSILEIAEVAYSNNDWTSAAQLFEEILKFSKDPKSREKALSGWGWCEFNRKKFGAARDLFDKLLAESPESSLAAEAAFMKAKTLQEEQKKPEAIEGFDLVLRKYPKTEFGFTASLQKARLLGDLQKLDEANAAYTIAADQFPDVADRDKLLDEWASLNYQHKRFARADEIFRKLVQQFPNSDVADNARMTLAESDLLAGKIDQARAQFRELSNAKTSDENVKQAALYQLLGIGVEKSDWTDVKRNAETLLTQAPDGKYVPQSKVKLAEAQINLLQFEPALKTLREFADQKAKYENEKWYPQVWVLLTDAYFRQKDYVNVSKTAAEFRAAKPQSDVLYLLDDIEGRSLIQQSKYPEAREVLERVVKSPVSERSEIAAQSQFLIAETFLLQKEYAKAQPEYEKVELLYNFPEWQSRALFQSAACQEELKQVPEAIKSYESLLAKWPASQQAEAARQRLKALKAKTVSGASS
ncbi:MAG: tetratricopeptide repeat protein [Planctomycetales bacterium]